MAAKIRQNDEVIVLAGKDKGKRGKVTKVLPNGKVFVEGVNIITKHEKPVPALGKAGGLVKKKLLLMLLILRFSIQNKQS
ncbi:ribosomal protein L24-like protein [Haemophilus pittmaniae HK 85]|uniref:Large ribosomal subunit protein uL24 n=1 Tax=Haemophilus pittmaniae HK 85 TaxID=1035188 RepID=F9Q8R9_9PAST|nr:ribosomal protein L24-like protein [Haemophilus pittmaniae HK 85]